jgi:hypothetical protein
MSTNIIIKLAYFAGFKKEERLTFGKRKPQFIGGREAEGNAEKTGKRQNYQRAG